jgi:hypothetical protein
MKPIMGIRNTIVVESRKSAAPGSPVLYRATLLDTGLCGNAETSVMAAVGSLVLLHQNDLDIQVTIVASGAR